MATIQEHIALARTLPARLQRFFVHNPPRALMVAQQTSQSFPESDTPAAAATSTFSTFKEKLNPFQPHKNPATGRWHPPIYSLRRQAELVKLAKENGVEELLPYTSKLSGERTKRREEAGLRVKGTGVGQKVRGHHQERTLKARLDKRRQAMLDMPALIQDWRQRGRSRGWKRWPR